MPLAIELAAAGIAALGLQGLASSVDHPLRLATSCSRSAPPRHRTLRAVLDWSYRLLSEEERKMFRRLSVFPGSFTVEDAATVYAEPTQTTAEAASRIIALLTKSLIVVSRKRVGNQSAAAVGGTRLCRGETFRERRARPHRYAGLAAFSCPMRRNCCQIRQSREGTFVTEPGRRVMEMSSPKLSDRRHKTLGSDRTESKS